MKTTKLKVKAKSVSKSKEQAAAKSAAKAKTKLQSKSKSASKTNRKNQHLHNLESKILLQEVWPQERDLMIRPERLKYVRKLIKEKGCVFCKSASVVPQFDTLCLYHTKHAQVLLNKFPYNNGHLLVIPKRHVGEIWELKPKEYKEVFLLIQKAMAVLYQVYGCDGVNMGLNHGSVAGAGIPEHIHFHVIPRWFGDVNFFPLIAETKVVIESHEQTYAKLYNAFQDKNFLKKPFQIKGAKNEL